MAWPAQRRSELTGVPGPPRLQPHIWQAQSAPGPAIVVVPDGGTALKLVRQRLVESAVLHIDRREDEAIHKT